MRKFHDTTHHCQVKLANMKKTLLLMLVLLGFTIALLGQTKMMTTKSGLQYSDSKVGTGDVAAKGATVQVHYTGWLWVNGNRGAKFDSSVDRGQPFSFKLGAGQVISGWDEGVEGMKVGGKRELIIPPNIAYGAKEVGGVIPANSTLDFEVELLKVSK